MATTDTWDSPALDQPISADLPAIQRKFQALVKGDPSLVQNPPVGAKRLVEISGGNWQVQQYNGSTWVNLGKLQMDVDTVDGYHAAITPQANTIAVRNASGKLEGDITGNAVTADSAATLSETLGVELGGTGATTAAQARQNLGVPPTSHASTATTHGVGSATQYGHVKLSDAVDSTSGASGGVAASSAAAKTAYDKGVEAKGAADAAQQSADAALQKLATPATPTTLGPVKVGDGLTMGEDGTLSADLATAEAAGRVKASETAKAGAVPLGGADGTLGEGWLKKAMDAAAAAQKTADEAKRAAEKKPEITVLSTRKSAGGTENWTITGVDTTSLLYITHKTTTTSTSNQGVFIQGASGIADGPQSLQPPLSLYALSYTTPGGTESMAGNILILRPTDSTVVLNIRWMTANGALTAWQYK